MYKKAKDYALYLLSFSSQSEKNIKDKLIKKDFDNETITKVIDFLNEYKFLNDEDLSRYVIKDNVQIKRYGKNKIKQNLYKKGISKELIEKTMSEGINEDDEYNNALYLASKKLEKIKESDKYKVYKKLYSHLLYKGFDYNISKKVVDNLLKTDF